MESESLKNQIALITEDYDNQRKQTENKINLMKLDQDNEIEELRSKMSEETASMMKL